MSKKSCPNCKSQLTVKRENHHYTACGLSYVTLADIEMQRCSSCGWSAATIPNIDGLHKTIAHCLVEKKSRLHGTEFRYLRKYLGHSSVDFAEIIGVSPETISRWENAKEDVSPVADRLVRVLIHTRQPVESYPLVEQLKQITREIETPQHFTLRTRDSRWEKAELQPTA